MRRINGYSPHKVLQIAIYIRQLKGWPHFTWDHEKLVSPLARVRHRQGRLLGRMEGLGFNLRSEAQLETLTLDVLKSSEIEGEIFSPDQVRSSISRRLGMDIAGSITKAFWSLRAGYSPFLVYSF